MSDKVDRRRFLKAVPAAGVAAYSSLVRVKGQSSSPNAHASNLNEQASSQTAVRKGTGVRIGTAAYTPVRDYPLRPKPGKDVRIKDNFWAPKIRTNAEVTIPFEVQKFEQVERQFSVNVLEAAITSLQSHPDTALEAQVARRIRALTRAGESA